MKAKLGTKNCLYPMPTVLVGVNVDDKPNYTTIAHVGIMVIGNISLSMAKAHYSNSGIKENQTFSVNIPSVDLMKKTDYCGLVSGQTIDKSKLFETFYGELETAPMIQECPINMECKLVHTLDFLTHDIFIGEITETYCDERCLGDDCVDIQKVQPILFSYPDVGYWKVGERIGKPWSVGRELKNR